MSGNITISNDIISWSWKSEILSQFSANEILIIGEYTIDNLNDDWFIVFVLKNRSWKDISMYAENITTLLNFLTDKFGEDLNKTQLANSIAWNSKINYPEELRHKELFDVQGKRKLLRIEVENYVLASR